jgi:hypothetical protein
VPWATTAPVVVFGLYPDFWLTAANGLEGGLFAFLLVRLVYLLSFGRLVYAGLCGGLLFATRPDSVLILPICAFYVLALSENRTLPFQRRVSRRLLPLLAPWLALIVAVTVWRLAYYGAWLPNTIEAKSIPASALDLVVVAKNAARGVLYWLGFLTSALPLTIGAALALAVAGQNRTVRLCTAILTAQVPIVLANGGDWMPHHRLLAVYAPLLVILTGVALDRVAHGGRTRRVLPPWLTTRRVGLLLASGCALVLLGNQWEATPDVGDGTSERCYGALAAATRPVLLTTDEVGLEALGTFGYTNPNVYVHDMMGLTDRHVALHGSVYYRAIGKTDPAYTYGTVRPNVILVHSGFNLLSRMVRVSEKEYNDTYSTYSMTSPDLPPCSEHQYVVSIRKDSAARILPAFAKFEPRPVTVPDFNDSRQWAIG